MSGFKYLMLSSIVIAFASLLSVNYEQMREDGRLSVLFSLQGFCRNETIHNYIPVEVDCTDRMDVRRFSTSRDASGFERYQPEEIVQIGREKK
jgi:hypothetical protein